MSGSEALRSCSYAKVRPIAAALQAAAQQPAQLWYRGRGGASAPARASFPKRPLSMAGVCAAAILLLAVPLFTLEADARGGFGGHGGGFGGHGGFAGRGGMGFGGARSFGVARFGGAGVGARSFGVARFGGSRGRAPSFRVAGLGGAPYGGRAPRGPPFRRRWVGAPPPRPPA